MAPLAAILGLVVPLSRAMPPESEYDAVGQQACATCHDHDDQNAWWRKDAHHDANSRLLNKERRSLEIARKYGMTEAEMVRGDSICMRCHGLVVGGEKRGIVREGVSCESCHGPAQKWLELHRTADKSLGTRRPTYSQELSLGKRDLTRLEVMATNCTSCHYITDQKLLRATHATGAAFPLADRIEKVRHWEHPLQPASELQAAFDAARSRREPVRFEPIPVIVAPPPSGDRPRFVRRRLPRARPPRAVERPAATLARDATTLPPFPVLAGQSLEDQLRTLKSRLELLDRRTRQKS